MFNHPMLAEVQQGEKNLFTLLLSDLLLKNRSEKLIFPHKMLRLVRSVSTISVSASPPSCMDQY